MLRLLWFVVVGSWRFPWERVYPKRVMCPEYDFETTGADIFRKKCGGYGDPTCTGGRCRAHCVKRCKCEDRKVLEHPREPKSLTDGSAYR